MDPITDEYMRQMLPKAKAYTAVILKPAVMDADPGVSAGTFVYEAHPCRGFPGDALP